MVDWSDSQAQEDTQHVRLAELLQDDEEHERGPRGSHWGGSNGSLDRSASRVGALGVRLRLVGRGGGRFWLVWSTWQSPGLGDGRAVAGALDTYGTLDIHQVWQTYQSLSQGEEPAAPVRSAPSATSAPSGITTPSRGSASSGPAATVGEAEEFWRGYLAGFDAPTPLPVDRQASTHWARDRRRVELPGEVAEGLERLAVQAGVTLGTVVRAAWALVLSRYAGEPDVVFGLPLSGGSPETEPPRPVAGVPDEVSAGVPLGVPAGVPAGVSSDAVPLRVRVPSGMPFAEWLADVRDTQVAVSRFASTPSSDIQRCSPISGDLALFDSVVTCHTRPEPAAGYREVSSRPLVVEWHGGERAAVEADFSIAAFDGVTVGGVLESLGVVLGVVAG
ncbi:condensation domain-containing protein, partial [Nonomuraea lactucae]|uniref:condensation domain-containing protein n=1 Tax=Nonomuraea lactucae TaxID=2249762 RepID=UPI001965C490